MSLSPSCREGVRCVDVCWGFDAGVSELSPRRWGRLARSPPCSTYGYQRVSTFTFVSRSFLAALGCPVLNVVNTLERFGVKPGHGAQWESAVCTDVGDIQEKTFQIVGNCFVCPHVNC